MRLLVGTYTADTGGRGPGVLTLDLDPSTGDTSTVATLELSGPSWLTRHPSRPVVFATGESAPGVVTTLSLADDGRLSVDAQQETGGGAPCHLALSDDGRMLYAANYTGGSLSAFRLGDDGRVVARTDVQQHELVDGPGPVAGRQEAPHVHMAVPGPRSDLVGAVDLGLDRVVFYRVGPDGRLSDAGSSALPPGTGPRQLLDLPGRPLAVVAGELGASLSLVGREVDGSFHVLDTRPSTVSPPAGECYPAQVAIGTDGLVYLSNRGADCISVFRATDESLEPLVDVPTGATWPRHFVIDDEWLLVAGERADLIDVLRLDGEGVPRPTGVQVPVPSPACLLPLD